MHVLGTPPENLPLITKGSHYEMLGVPAKASMPEITRAHRRAVIKCHPDLFQDPVEKATAREELTNLNVAKDILTDPAKRRGYDRELAMASLSARSDLHRTERQMAGILFRTELSAQIKEWKQGLKAVFSAFSTTLTGPHTAPAHADSDKGLESTHAEPKSNI